MKAIYEFLTKLLSFFPDDPLAEIIQGIAPLDTLGYLNYFLPISQIVTITEVWVGGLIAARVALFFYNLLIRKV